MAPEQYRKKIVNERTDIYNFGATMYRMATWRLPPSVAQQEGALPLDPKTFDRLLKPVGGFAPTAPRALCDLIHRCMAFLPDNRPDRMSTVQTELSELVEELVTSPEERLEVYEWE
jgi:serine/threonine protein kinase